MSAKPKAAETEDHLDAMKHARNYACICVFGFVFGQNDIQYLNLNVHNNNCFCNVPVLEMHTRIQLSRFILNIPFGWLAHVESLSSRNQMYTFSIDCRCG